ncbi:hypothetical protein J2D73_04730 [Acetobacter sacchari]|uniref:Uncharacterized protein n=1 Tax=Acetobacter sacchari TaxID=2661687 RepID=A0ABS3LT64_9PROT|nr:hypothetical protein [Acetobacter sacchari]MBO1359102.1 hypothetical protein [Acetobacter sacchari]
MANSSQSGAQGMQSGASNASTRTPAGSAEIRHARALDAAGKVGAGKFDTQAKLIAASDIAWAIVGGGAPVQTGAGITGNGLDALSSAYSATQTASLPANPLLDDNRALSSGNRVTLEYLNNRKRKSLGGDLLGLGGAIGSLGTHGVNVGSGTRHLNSSLTTFIHLVKLHQIARGLPADCEQMLVEWCDVVVRMKAGKLGVRALKLGGSVVPTGLIAGHVGSYAAMASTVTGASTATGVKLCFGHACFAAAAGLHWLAFEEQHGALRRGTLRGVSTPASDVVRELFKRRGLTRIFGSYNVQALIREQAGWLAIGDKILST